MKVCTRVDNRVCGKYMRRWDEKVSEKVCCKFVGG